MQENKRLFDKHNEQLGWGAKLKQWASLRIA